MNLDNLTLGQIKELKGILNANTSTAQQTGLNSMIGRKVIVRTYAAGVWFGEIEQKDGEEVILRNARRMYEWWAKESISLSAVAIHGIKQDKSKIIEAVESVWLRASEIILCTNTAINSIEGAKYVKANEA